MKRLKNNNKYRLSRYTRAIDATPGTGLLLHNSFMGALARLPESEALRLGLLAARDKNRDEHPPFQKPDNDAVFDELARQGFFVRADIDETARVEKLLEAEREQVRHLIILPHEDCNFRCTYCYETFARGRMPAETVSAVKRLLDREVGERPVLNIGWFGGEPCLALREIEVISDHALALCAERDVLYRSAITTNGWFLKESTVTSLLNRGIGHFQVTIDGSEEAHDTMRKLRGGQATFRRIFDNLVAMTRREEDFSVAIRVNFNELTISTIEGFLEEAQPYFAGDDRFFLDFHAVGRWGGPNDTQMNVVEERSAAEARLGLIARSRCKGFSAASILDALKPHGSACYAGKASSLVIGSDGRLYKCTVAFEDPRNQVGWLREDGTLEIDKQKWRRWVEPTSASGKCASCSYSAACQSRACPLAAIEEGEPPCPFTDRDFGAVVSMAAGSLEEAPDQRTGGRRYETT